MPTIKEIEKQIYDLQVELSKLRKENPPESVADHAFNGWNGPVSLSQLFEGHDELIVVHNMGKRCNYCTLWADGLTGFVPHIRTRAAIVLVNGDPTDVQKKVAESRGWNFTLVQDADTTFSREMGYFGEDGPEPGVSTFKKLPDGSIVRTNTTNFGPGDVFCPIWHLWDLLDGGQADWHPKPVTIDGVTERPMEEVVQS